MERVDQGQEGQEAKGACEALGDRMKAYERSTAGLRLDPTKPWIVRLDGHKFSRFTRFFTRPYDTRIHIAMVETAKSLLKDFNPVAVFTCSDEITLVFPAEVPQEGEQIEPVEPTKSKKSNPQNDMPFGGKVLKICTLMAGFASAQFNYHLKSLAYDAESESKLAAHVHTSLPYFDARAHNVPSNAEAFNNVFWRACYDYRRNSISGLAQHHFIHSELQGLNTAQLLAKLKQEKGVDWNECPEWYKFGTLIKREQFIHNATTPKGEAVEAIRTRVISMPFTLATFSAENIHTLLCKALASPEVQAVKLKAAPEDTSTSS